MTQSCHLIKWFCNKSQIFKTQVNNQNASRSSGDCQSPSWKCRQRRRWSSSGRQEGREWEQPEQMRKWFGILEEKLWKYPFGNDDSHYLWQTFSPALAFLPRVSYLLLSGTENTFSDSTITWECLLMWKSYRRDNDDEEAGCDEAKVNNQPDVKRVIYICICICIYICICINLMSRRVR